MVGFPNGFLFSKSNFLTDYSDQNLLRHETNLPVVNEPMLNNLQNLPNSQFVMYSSDKYFDGPRLKRLSPVRLVMFSRRESHPAHRFGEGSHHQYMSLVSINELANFFAFGPTDMSCVQV